MPYFVGTCVLLAIVYVLSRTGAPAGCATVPGGVPDGFDIDAYREERLAATPPNIIECAEASEGESQVRIERGGGTEPTGTGAGAGAGAFDVEFARAAAAALRCADA